MITFYEFITSVCKNAESGKESELVLVLLQLEYENVFLSNSN